MKVRLKNAEFLSEYGGRLPQGAVLDVPDAQAEKWYLLGIATKATAKAKTFAEEKLERLAVQREEEELNAAMGGDRRVFNAMVTREGTSPPEVEHDDAMPMFEDEEAQGDDKKPARKH